MENLNATATINQPAWFSIALKYGILTGLASGVLSIIMFISGAFETVWIGIVLALVISVGGIVMAHKEFKRLNGGYMNYGKGLVIGTVLSLIAGLISGLISFAYIQFVDPGVLDRMKEMQMAMMEKFGMPEDKMEEAVAKLDEQFTPTKQLTSGLTSGLIGGFILSLIVTAVTKRNKPEFE